MKKLTLIILFIFLAINALNSQVAVGYASDGHTLLLSLNQGKMIWGELRANTKAYNEATWSYSDRGITQAYLLFNIFRFQNADLYGGVGAGANLLSKDNDKWASANIPLGIKINPISKLPNLYFFGEYNPMLILKDDVPVIHTVSAGLRFVLIKETK
jgi:hypothetical protein